MQQAEALVKTTLQALLSVLRNKSCFVYNYHHLHIIYIVSDPCECFDGSGGSGGSASGSMLRETFPPCPPHTQCKDFKGSYILLKIP